MEQKQLDEIDDSYFGEEFIDDLEDIKIEEVKPKARKLVRKVKSPPMSPEKTVPFNSKIFEPKSSGIKPEIKIDTQESHLKTETAKIGTKAEAVKTETKSEVKTELKAESKKVEPKPEAKVESKIGSSTPFNPWAEEEKEKSSGHFKTTSTWKALTGIMVILLLFSIFTDGFQFSKDQSSPMEGELSLDEAKIKALDFVNHFLLKPPFTANLVSSQEEDGLYKLTLSVAGDIVDSYMTKDGKLFFPQGLVVEEVVGELETVTAETANKVEIGVDDVTAAGVVEPEPEVKEEVVTEESIIEDAPNNEVPDKEIITDLTVPVLAKKWLFQPDVIKAKQGDIIHISLNPAKNFPFTFAVPDLGVEQKITGPTTVNIEASRKGTFEFICSDCEDWRGMKGTLVIS